MDDDNATVTRPKIRRNRPTRYPASLAVLLTAEQRAQIDVAAEAESLPIAPIVRRWLDLGGQLDEALKRPDFPGLELRFELAIGTEADDRSATLAKILDLGEREVRRIRDAAR